MSSFYILAGLLVLLVLGAIIWRFSSLRTAIPCPTWLSWVVEFDNPLFKNNSVSQIVQHLALTPGMQVLDYGCGPGRLTLPVAKAVAPDGEVTAFDIQAGMLQRAKAKAQAQQVHNIQFVQGKADAGKLGQNQYDRVLLVTVLGELPNPKVALTEIFASLKPGGILSVTEFIADPHFQGRKKVIRWAQSIGFVVQTVFGNSISYTVNFVKA